MREWIDHVESLVENQLWEGKYRVWNRGDFSICVDDPEDATYVTAWVTEDGKTKRIGELSTKRMLGYLDRRAIGNVDIVPSYRGNGLAAPMYLALLNHLWKRYDGIASYLPDRLNHSQIPAIWRRIGGYVDPNNEDVILADRP